MFNPRDPNIDPAGLEGLGAVIRRQQYTYADTFTALATLATRSGTIKVSGDSGFVVEFPVVECNIEGVIGSSIAGTPLPRESQSESGGNELPSLGLVTIKLYINAEPLMNVPVRATLWTGVGVAPGYPLTKIWVPAGASISYDLYNGTAQTIGGQLALRGQRVWSK